MVFLDERLEKAQIVFQERMSLKQAESLLIYIAKNLPAKIECTVSQGKRIGSGESIVHYSPKISGRINHMCKYVFDSFECLSYGINYTDFTFLKFMTIPGYYNEHRKEVRQLWDDVRKIVNQYFQKGQEHKHKKHSKTKRR